MLAARDIEQLGYGTVALTSLARSADGEGHPTDITEVQ